VKIEIYIDRFAHPAWPSPAFRKLCVRGQRHILSTPVYGCLLENFFIPQQYDWPLAPLSLLAQYPHIKSAYVYRLHWAHVNLRGDHFALHPLAVSAAEQAALLASLHEHFQVQGNQFLALDDASAVLLLPQVMAVNTYPFSQVLGQDVRRYSATGEQALAWRGLMNEVQMLLHSHPINQQREQQGLPAINSLWLDYGGALPSVSRQRSARLIGAAAFVQGLAELTNNAYLAAPEDFCLADVQADQVFCLDEQSRLDDHFWRSLYAGLASRQIKQLLLYIDMAQYTMQIQLSPLHLWRFWRRDAAELAQFFGEGG